MHFLSCSVTCEQLQANHDSTGRADFNRTSGITTSTLKPRSNQEYKPLWEENINWTVCQLPFLFINVNMCWRHKFKEQHCCGLSCAVCYYSLGSNEGIMVIPYSDVYTGSSATQGRPALFKAQVVRAAKLIFSYYQVRPILELLIYDILLCFDKPATSILLASHRVSSSFNPSWLKTFQSFSWHFHGEPIVFSK